MNKYMLILIGILCLSLAGAGLALKKQLQVNGEQRQAILERDAALAHAKELKNAAEAAVGVRDQKLTQIKETNRSLQNALKSAIANDECSRKPIPAELDRLLRDRAPKAGESLPTADPHART